MIKRCIQVRCPRCTSLDVREVLQKGVGACYCQACKKNFRMTVTPVYRWRRCLTDEEKTTAKVRRVHKRLMITFLEKSCPKNEMITTKRGKTIHCPDCYGCTYYTHTIDMSYKCAHPDFPQEVDLNRTRSTL